MDHTQYPTKPLATAASRGGPTTDVIVTDRRLREYLCFSHGHTGQYGDDGELQCGACARFGQWDYRRAPIAELLDTIEAVNMARLVERSQPPSGVRGDPGAPGTVNAPARDR